MNSVHIFVSYPVWFFISVGVILAVIRLIKGKSVASRAVAIDVLTITTTVVLVLFALIFNRGIFLDVALIYSILSYIGVVALARYIERGM